MSQRIADEIENRRGLVLGLTLAELLLLLLFLLLIALSWRMDRLQRYANDEHSLAEKYRDRIEANKEVMQSVLPLLDEIKRHGRLQSDTVQTLVAKLADLSKLEKENADLRKTIGALRAQNAGLEATSRDSKKLKQFDQAIAAASKIDPNDPPAVLTRALQVLTRLGPDTSPDQVRPLSEMSADQGKVAKVVAERDRLRHTLNALKRSPNGLTYPPCWSLPSGHPVYIFDVTIRDDGLLVHNNAPDHMQRPEVKLIEPFARDKVIAPAAFERATRKLFDWSNNQDCRFYVVVRDATGPTSKQRYKQSLSLIDSNFYYLLRPVGATAPGEHRSSSSRKNVPVAVGKPLVLPQQPRASAPQ